MDEERYDTIVIGSGLGGLTAGALCSLDGGRALVLERNANHGGAATVYRKRGATMEAALHAIDGLDSQDCKALLIERLKLKEAIDFVPIPELYALRHPLLGEELVHPADSAKALETMLDRFPAQEAGLRKYFRIICLIRNRFTELIRGLDDPWFWLKNAARVPFRFWPFYRYSFTSLAGFLTSLFGDDEAVKLALCANLAYYAADPRDCSLLYFAVGQGSFLTGGGHFPRGGSQVLSDHLAALIRGAGGEVSCGRIVERILVEGGRAVGVVHANAATREDCQEVRAPVVIGNAAPPALREMLPDGARQAFFKPFRKMQLSTSLWSVHLLVDRPLADFGVDHYSTCIYPAWVDRLARHGESAELFAGEPGERVPIYVLANYGAIDSGVGGPNKHLAVMNGCDRLRNWAGLDEEAYAKRKAAWLEVLLSDLERRFPGVREHITFAEMATARTMEHYLNTPGGVVYGYSQKPLQAGYMRPGAKTHVPGLFLASAFVRYGGGFTCTMMAGENAWRSATDYVATRGGGRA